MDKKFEVQIEAWALIGEGRGGLFIDKTIAEIAKKYKKA